LAKRNPARIPQQGKTKFEAIVLRAIITTYRLALADAARQGDGRAFLLQLRS
jgi:hypothetical protein